MVLVTKPRVSMKTPVKRVITKNTKIDDSMSTDRKDRGGSAKYGAGVVASMPSFKPKAKIKRYK